MFYKLLGFSKTILHKSCLVPASLGMISSSTWEEFKGKLKLRENEPVLYVINLFEIVINIETAKLNLITVNSYVDCYLFELVSMFLSSVTKSRKLKFPENQNPGNLESG